MFSPRNALDENTAISNQNNYFLLHSTCRHFVQSPQAFWVRCEHAYAEIKPWALTRNGIKQNSTGQNKNAIVTTISLMHNTAREGFFKIKTSKSNSLVIVYLCTCISDHTDVTQKFTLNSIYSSEIICTLNSIRSREIIHVNKNHPDIFALVDWA